MSAHFSFSNSLYDKCNLEKKEQESTGPFNWITDNVYSHPHSCHASSSPFMHNPFKSIPANSIDIENDLRNQTRLLSRCPSTRFDPTELKNCKECKNCDSGIPCDCLHCKDNKYKLFDDCKNNVLVPEYTRVNKPCNILSGISINRFHPLCEDLQDMNKIQANNYIGSNTRLQVKDAFEQAKKIRGSGAVPLFMTYQ